MVFIRDVLLGVKIATPKSPRRGILRGYYSSKHQKEAIVHLSYKGNKGMATGKKGPDNN